MEDGCWGTKYKGEKFKVHLCSFEGRNKAALQVAVSINELEQWLPEVALRLAMLLHGLNSNCVIAS